MNDFIGGELDGLICTTIVEMGLDIPNANTILIINSHKLGLSQLHQLRGRVGRSAKQGYCYFLIPSNDVPNSSKARLDSIIKYSKLGEGFLIAQQDLDLRGGGEILGEKQSGHINDVGITLYLSMLKEALKSNKSSEYEKHLYEVNFYDSAYIGTNYLPSPTERLKIYKKIQITSNNDKVDEIKQNLIDRCGKMPSESMNLLNNKKIQNRIVNTGIKSIKSYEDRTNFILSSHLKENILDNLLKLISKDSEKYSLTKDNKFIYKFIESDANKRRNNVNLLLDEIL
jgi:transcription-repair coupling factor (superfamily II helicase)